jgi:hypothetical protein
MAQLKAARATDVPPAMPDPDPDVVAADLGACVRHGRVDGLAAGSGRAEATATATTTAAAADQGRRRPPLVVVGHRGKGMNALASPDPRLRGDVRENTLRAFNAAAASHPAVAYVEFDVQVNHGLSFFFLFATKINQCIRNLRMPACATSVSVRGVGVSQRCPLGRVLGPVRKKVDRGAAVGELGRGWQAAASCLLRPETSGGRWFPLLRSREPNLHSRSLAQRTFPCRCA